MPLTRDWPRYAHALDLYLEGMTFRHIGTELGVSPQRAHQLVDVAAKQLAFRVFKGVPSPNWAKVYRREQLEAKRWAEWEATEAKRQARAWCTHKIANGDRDLIRSALAHFADSAATMHRFAD